MGHLRLGTLPDTTRWRRVVAAIAEGESIAQVASATSEAAQKGLDQAHDDAGLCHAVLLLAKIALAARQEEFGDALEAAGLPSPSQPNLFDIAGGFADAMDAHFRQSGGRTDIGEMAQLAAIESLTSLIGQRSVSLFGTTSAEVKGAVYEFSTKKGFSALAHDFFSRFTQRFLTYHLGRELSNHVGGNGRFADPNEHTEFVKGLATHCREAAVIVREFSGGWYSKANFEDGISAQKARNFVNYALTKLRLELKVRGERDG